MQCRTCGFLSLRHNGTMRLDEAPEKFRETGSAANNDGAVIHDRIPVCFKGVAQFRNEVKQSKRASLDEQVLDVISKDRECSESAPSQIGYTPKEHADMIWEAEDRRWRERQDEVDRQWRDAQAEREHRWRKEDRRSAIINLVVSVLLAIATGAAGLVAGSKLPWFRELEPPPVVSPIPAPANR